MSTRAIEDVLNVAKTAALEVLKAACKDGFQWSDLGAFLASPDFQAAVAKAVPEAAQVPGEVLTLGLMDDLELARYAYSASMDLVTAVKSCQKPAA